MLKQIAGVFIAAAGLVLAAAPAAFAQTSGGSDVTSGYASVNGLEMYYEIHGSGEPLVVLHGAYMNIPAMGEIIPRLAADRQVIAVELQGHGRTADVDRPLTYEQMADDVAALMDAIGVEQADIFGYSMGGGVALQIAIRHPERVRRLITAAATYNSGGLQPGLIDMIKTITPEMFAGTPMETEYLRFAPKPEDWPALVAKLVQLDSEVHDWPAESIQGLTAPTLVIAGDNDAVTPEHAVDMYRLRGGGVNGDMVGLPNARLAILPGTTHISLIDRVDWLHSMITEFLSTPIPE